MRRQQGKQRPVADAQAHVPLVTAAIGQHGSGIGLLVDARLPGAQVPVDLRVEQLVAPAAVGLAQYIDHRDCRNGGNPENAAALD